MQNLYRTAAVVTVFSTFEHGLGFLYRILLSRILGSEGLGVYQASLSIFAVFLTLTSSGLPITLSRTVTRHRSAGDRQKEQSAAAAAIVLTLAAALPLTLLLFLLRTPFLQIFSDERCGDLFYIFLIGLSFTSVYAVLRGNFWGNRQFLAYSLIELLEEIVMIVTGVLLLVFSSSPLSDVRLAAIAVLVSYLCSFSIAVFYFYRTGGRLRSPKGELKPLLSAALPVTAMRTGNSLVNSLVSVLFPARLLAAGASSAKAMSEYGVVYGMVMPVLMIPSTLIGSIALVLVPEFSECFYKKDERKLSLLVEKALNATLLVAGILIPFFAVCGQDVGILLYSNAKSGTLIAACAPVLVPMSVTMICTSLLNSMNCEKQTLFIFLCGAAIMLGCVWLLPSLLGSGALLLGMAGDYTVTAVLSLLLLQRKTGKLRSAKYFLRLLCAVLPAVAACMLARRFFALFFGYFPALLLTLLTVTAAELLLFSVFRLWNLQNFLRRFFKKRRPASRRLHPIQNNTAK